MHVEVFVISLEISVVIWLGIVEITSVSRGLLMTLSWRETHVGGIFPLGAVAALTFCNLFLCVLVESKEWKDDDLVVEEGSRNEHHEANDGFPVESLKSERDGHDPDEEGS